MNHLLKIGLVAAGLVFASSAFAADGGKIYSTRCSICHDPNGAGSPMGPALKGNEFITKGKSADIKKVIIEGRTGKDKKFPKIIIDMPKNPMPDNEAEALINFMQIELQK